LPAADKRRTVSQARASALEPRLPKLSIKLAAGAPDGAHVTRDGVELGAAALGTPLPVDPGEHVVVVSALGRADRPFKADHQRARIRSLEVAAARSAPYRPKRSRKRRIPLEPLPPSAQHESKTLGYVLGGVGIAGFITGGIAGALVLQKKGVVGDHCNADRRCDAEGLVGDP